MNNVNNNNANNVNNPPSTPADQVNPAPSPSILHAPGPKDGDAHQAAQAAQAAQAGVPIPQFVVPSARKDLSAQFSLVI